MQKRSELERRLPALKQALDQAGGLWVAWPKRSSGVATDLGDAAVRELGLASGLVDNKVCAIDATWSGLRFVYRLADRTGSRRTAPARITYTRAQPNWCTAPTADPSLRARSAVWRQSETRMVARVEATKARDAVLDIRPPNRRSTSRA